MNKEKILKIIDSAEELKEYAEEVILILNSLNPKKYWLPAKNYHSLNPKKYLLPAKNYPFYIKIYVEDDTCEIINGLDNEILFEIPLSWLWTPLEELKLKIIAETQEKDRKIY